MKNALLFIVIFGLSAVFYAGITHFFTTEKKSADTAENRAPTSTANTLENETEKTNTIQEQQETETEMPVVITEDGSLLDGPFVIFNNENEDTGATVRIIRSPEETLLQFENWDESYSLASHVYFASDRSATDFYNLGPAKMSEDYLVYGIPLDADLSAYNYILIYQTQLDETLYYAKIR